MACPVCLSHPTVPHGTGGTVLGTPLCPIVHGLSRVSVPSQLSHMGWGGGGGGDSSVSHRTWFNCPKCPFRPTVPHGPGRTVLGTPMHISPIIHGLSHVFVSSYGLLCPMVCPLSHTVLIVINEYLQALQ